MFKFTKSVNFLIIPLVLVGGSVIDFAKLVNIGPHNDQVFTNFPNHIHEIEDDKGTSLLLFLLQPQGLELRLLTLQVLYRQQQKNSQFHINFYIPM